MNRASRRGLLAPVRARANATKSSACVKACNSHGVMALDNKDLVEAVKRKREREGLSIRALASAVGVSFSSLARIERGDGAPDNNSQIRLLEWLGDEGREAGLAFEDVAYVHFRASKNAGSRTIQCLLKAAEVLKDQAREDAVWTNDPSEWSSIMLSKEEMESIADDLRNDLGLSEDDPLESLKIRVNGVDVYTPGMLPSLPTNCIHHMQFEGCGDWSAMSVPLNLSNDRWAILLNDQHSIERQRVTILEEYWHIMLGHKLTKIAKVSGSFGRTYDSSEENDAYYLASASLLPKSAIIKSIEANEPVDSIATRYGTSPQLVEYRIKRLGLWRLHRKLDVKLDNDI